MSTTITESHGDDHIAPPQPAVLAEDGDQSGHTIHGIAIGSNDVTRGSSKVRKLWPASTLKDAAATLAGRPLVRDHENTTKGSVGRVTDAKFKPGVGVLYRANLFDDALAQKIENGQLEVSPRIAHTPVEELERDDDSGAFEIDRAVFDNLSLVITGAAKSNTVQVGDTDELSAAELEAEFADDGDATESQADGEGAEDDFSESESPDDGDEDHEPERAAGDDDDDPTSEQSDADSETSDSPNESTDERPERDDSDPIRMIVSDSYKPATDQFTMTHQKLAIDTENLPASADEFSNPVVIERSDLDELEAAAETDGDEYEELRDEIERLADIKEERDDLRDRVDELKEYEERLSEVDEMRDALASDLADEIDHFDADELSENFSVSELREKIDAVGAGDETDDESDTEELEGETDAEADDPDPAPRGGTETEELEAELSDEDAQRIADLEDTIEWYHEHNWDAAAEELEAELDELRPDQ